MEMPKDCWHCQMFCNCFACEGYNCHCAALGKDIGDENEVPRNKRRENCPLTPIPAHGKLIDADALIKELTLDDEDDNCGASLLMAIFLELLKAAPTIIPANEDK